MTRILEVDEDKLQEEEDDDHVKDDVNKDADADEMKQISLFL